MALFSVIANFGPNAFPTRTHTPYASMKAMNPGDCDQELLDRGEDGLADRCFIPLIKATTIGAVIWRFKATTIGAVIWRFVILDL